MRACRSLVWRIVSDRISAARGAQASSDTAIRRRVQWYIGFNCTRSPDTPRYTGRVALPANSRLGPYEIIDLLGVGGMGEVYRARDPRIGREVAIKILPPRFGSDP